MAWAPTTAATASSSSPHAKAIYRQARVDLSSPFGMRAPYGKKFKAGVARFMKKPEQGDEDRQSSY